MRQQFGMEFAEVSIPFGPGGLISSANRVSTAVQNVFQSARALNSTAKLSSNATRKTTHSFTEFWHRNRGFLGELKSEYLMPGKIIDRYGKDSDRFVSPRGTTWEARSLPEYAKNFKLNAYEVVKPFEVKSGIISPAFEQMGLGVQYELPLPIYILKKRGVIREINIGAGG